MNRPPSPPRRPDESMSLLNQVMQRPLDPGYAVAAAARAAGRPASRRSLAVAGMLAVLCGSGLTWAVGDLRRPAPQVAEQRQALAQEITRRTAVADALQRSNDDLRRQIAQAQAAALARSGKSQLTTQLDGVAAGVGDAPVIGPGLEIVENDAPTAVSAADGDPRTDPTADQGRVIDRDLQIVVNGLWAAGAEAISINRQRLGALSAIRSAGQAILVDYRPLVPPYVIDAVGDPAALQAGFARSMAGPYLQALRDNYGVRASFASKDQLSLPASRSPELRYARPSPAASATDSAPAGSPSPGSSYSQSAPAPSPVASSPGSTTSQGGQK